MLQQFLSHCCRERHYFFEVKKCGSADFTICKPVRLNPEVFQEIKNFPDPMPAEDNNDYLSFGDVYGKNTTEKHCPSLKKRSSKQKTLPFHAKLQHVCNANLMPYVRMRGVRNIATHILTEKVFQCST